MDPQSRELLEKTYELLEENNRLLQKVRGVQKREMLWRIVKYVVIIGITLGAFYYLEPYINKVKGVYSSVTGIGENVKNIPDANSLQDLLKKL